MKILVTGGKGQLGRDLEKVLLSAGVFVKRKVYHCDHEKVYHHGVKFVHV